jgi:hypothetical protein
MVIACRPFSLALWPGWKQSSYVNTLSRHYCPQEPLLNPCYIHIGLLFVNFSVLNRNQVCRFRSLHIIKIMQMEMLNAAVFMPPKAIGDERNVMS